MEANGPEGQIYVTAPPVPPAARSGLHWLRVGDPQLAEGVNPFARPLAPWRGVATAWLVRLFYAYAGPAPLSQRRLLWLLIASLLRHPGAQFVDLWRLATDPLFRAAVVAGLPPVLQRRWRSLRATAADFDTALEPLAPLGSTPALYALLNHRRTLHFHRLLQRGEPFAADLSALDARTAQFIGGLLLYRFLLAAVAAPLPRPYRLALPSVLLVLPERMHWPERAQRHGLVLTPLPAPSAGETGAS